MVRHDLRSFVAPFAIWALLAPFAIWALLGAVGCSGPTAGIDLRAAWNVGPNPSDSGESRSVNAVNSVIAYTSQSLNVNVSLKQKLLAFTSRFGYVVVKSQPKKKYL